MRKHCNFRFFLPRLSLLILFVLPIRQTLSYSILLLEEIIGDPSPDAKAAAAATDVLLKKSQTKTQTRHSLKIFSLSFS